MEFNKIKDISGLVKLIDSCKGNIYLIAEDGSVRINMKSKISQYFSIVNMLTDDSIDNIFLETDNREDMEKLIDFVTAQSGS